MEDDKKTTEETNPNDLEIENKALKELLENSKKTIDELNKTLVEVKTTNAKLVNQLDVSKVKTVEELLNESFNKYFQK